MRSIPLLAIFFAIGCNNGPSAPAPPEIALPPTPGGPPVENADYANWKRFPVGTAVKRKSVAERGPNQTISIETLTLVEVADSELVVERQNTTERNDGSYKAVNPPEPRRYPRTFPLPAGMSAEDFQKPSLKASPAGEEAITAAGKSYKTKKFTWTDGTEAGPMSVTVWLSDEMPGRVVKQLMQVPANKTTTTDEVIEVKNP